MLWLILFLVVICVAVYLIDKKMKAKFEDKFNPRDWDLPASVELPLDTSPPASVPALAINEKFYYEKKLAPLVKQQLEICKVLQNALPDDCIILTNVSAADVFSATETYATRATTLTGRKFEFVIYKNKNKDWDAICAVTLSESLDAILKMACESVSLPYIYIGNYPVEGINSICETILKAINVGIHIKNEIRVSDISSKLCSICSASMLMRKAKNGIHEGKLFWVCSTYPKCRGTVLAR